MYKLDSLIPRMKILLFAALLSSLPAAPSAAQSLDPDRPASMQSGPNRGTIDNFVGANYFYFWAGPGECKVRASFKSMTLKWNADQFDGGA